MNLFQMPGPIVIKFSEVVHGPNGHFGDVFLGLGLGPLNKPSFMNYE